jgi:hypothetical protein
MKTNTIIAIFLIFTEIDITTSIIVNAVFTVKLIKNLRQCQQPENGKGTLTIMAFLRLQINYIKNSIKTDKLK